MRLIDANELKTAIEDRIDNIPSSDYDNGWNNAIYAVIDEIDNAPTVKTYETFSYEKGFQDGKYSAEMERPHGKWEEDWQEDLDFMSRKGWKCPFCKWRTTYGATNFCMNCGADLRGGKASD